MESAKTAKIGLWSGVSIGVGAIVGGGIFVLGGVALRETGSGAIFAFLLNGGIALLTAASLAQMARLFPESGGFYTFAKRILSVRVAFVVGWVVWFAHLVAALLYALGFSEYLIDVLGVLFLGVFGVDAALLRTSEAAYLAACGPVLFYSYALVRAKSKGTDAANVIKLALFVLLILAGLAAFFRDPTRSFSTAVQPLLPNGLGGLGAAMGLTFIALQGFEVIAGAAGEVKNAPTTVPKAMYLAIGIALIIYLPFLFITAAAGAPAGEQISAICAVKPGTCIADAASVYMGTFGYFVVVLAALFSTLSALYANLLSSLILIKQMSQDRTMPRIFSQMGSRHRTPVYAIAANVIVVTTLLGLVTAVETAGSAASLVFLIAYSLGHLLSFVAQRRAPRAPGEQSRPLPIVQLIGGAACVSLAVFQGINEPTSGLIVLAWLVVGMLLYVKYFAVRAEAVDAFAQAQRPELVGYRGFTPLVLVPITNPDSAPSLIGIGHALAARGAGKVLVLRVVRSSTAEGSVDQEIEKATQVLHASLAASMQVSSSPAEAMLTISDNPWREINRVAVDHSCHSLVLGVNRLDVSPLENLFDKLEGDVALLCAPPGWSVDSVKKILVPVGGKHYHDTLRAKVLGTIARSSVEEICMASVVSPQMDTASRRRVEKELADRAQDEGVGVGVARLIESSDAAAAVIDESAGYDLLLVGLTRKRGGALSFGNFVSSIAKEARCAVLIIGGAN